MTKRRVLNDISFNTLLLVIAYYVYRQYVTF